MTQKEMQSILEIGTAISSEKDYNRLLEMILNRIMELTHADAGTLYLADGDLLRFKIMCNNTMHTCEGGDGKEPNLPPIRMSRENGISSITSQVKRQKEPWSPAGSGSMANVITSQKMKMQEFCM